ncbi:FMN-binding negative transcriptional regulator [Aureispira anguillae]|uniref:FMN-binding negative transcriptional regulator n=1 Tax=Aureispira anguillae TaxID=2864201 RepID=A0A916DVT0_9BACT|nr:FMN-binding negative transcriptional regulator [Aureispira anguillae]BDS13406.1 FMN-binding negative transcriptional regulator [Aureispira anguillae]
MYIPSKFKLEDEAQIRAYIRQYPFATLITSSNNHPIATHLPFILEQEGDQWYLLGHMAKANPQWQLLEETQPLVIFQEPHAYISPSFYEKEENVPTWNYIAVHVYGQAELLPTNNQAIAVLEKTIEVFEKDFQVQWKKLDDAYKKRLLKGMVAFRIEIKTLEGKEKLSQNKTEQERQTISDGLLQSNDSSAQQLGEIMKNKL